jgi:hypothetical protein
MKPINWWIVVVLVIAGLQLTACTQKTSSASTVDPAEVAPMEGTELNELVLLEEAANRLAIQTETVREEQVTRKRRVAGEIVAVPDASTGNSAQNDGILVRVSLSEADLEQVDQSQPALILPLVKVEGATGINARVVDAPAMEDGQDNAATLYYAPESANHDLAVGQRVRVELALGSPTPRKIIPYAAVIYDPTGATWTYTTQKPLTYIRHSITVDYIDGEHAILLEGPDAGTLVVTAGAAELYGEEFGVGH